MVSRRFRTVRHRIGPRPPGRRPSAIASRSRVRRNRHFHRARLFERSGGASGDPLSVNGGEKDPWDSPPKDLAEARRLIEKHGYWRRKEELEDAEATAKSWASIPEGK